MVYGSDYEQESVSSHKKYYLNVWKPDQCNKEELIILGMGHTMLECPYDAEVWGVNMGYSQIIGHEGHLEKLFIAHTQLPHPTQPEEDIFRWDEVGFLMRGGVEVLNIHRLKALKFKQYPLKRISKKFGTNFFTDTICYMIAYAIDRVTIKDKKTGKLLLKHPFKLRLYGVDMHTPDEYQWEKSGIEFWLGYLMGLGGTVENTQGSTVLKNPTGKPYGIKYFKMKDVDPDNLRKKKVKKGAIAPAGSLQIFYKDEQEEPCRPFIRAR